MPRPIEQRAHFESAADEVYAALVDPEHLAARLAELGGKDAAVTAHEPADDGGTRLVLRQGVPVEFLPSVVRRFTGEDLVLDRVERWRRRDGGGWTADLEVTVRGLPGSITGTEELTDAVGGGSDLVVRARTSVPVPLVGGKIEGIVVEHVGNLMGWEADFTRRWLART